MNKLKGIVLSPKVSFNLWDAARGAHIDGKEERALYNANIARVAIENRTATDSVSMNLNRNEFTTAFAFTLDFLEKEFRGSTENHTKRTGLIAVHLGRALGLSDSELFDLSAYAMLHDNGITHECYNAIAADGACRLDCTASHCIIGERNLEAFPFLSPRANVIKYHHEAYDGSGCFGIAGDNIPLFAQIIGLVEPMEIAYSSGEDKDSIISGIVNQSRQKYSPTIIDAFKHVVEKVGFWLSIDNHFLDSEIKKHIPSYSINIELSQLLPISRIMSGIIDSKSPFTANHSRGLTEKTAVMCDYYNFDENKKAKMMIASDLHDIGKLAIPNEIIDKPDKLTDSEFNQIKAHAFYTRKTIEAVQGFEDIADWAADHHEKLDGSGYPFGLTADTLCFESQLIGCLDIYQALTEDRPYRKSLSHSEACQILEDMAVNNKISREITTDLRNILGC